MVTGLSILLRSCIDSLTCCISIVGLVGAGWFLYLFDCYYFLCLFCLQKLHQGIKDQTSCFRSGFMWKLWKGDWMLLTVNYSGINLNSLLIKISNEIEIKGIYTWERCINPIDNNRLKDKFHHAAPAHIKNYLYNNEISGFDSSPSFTNGMYC